MTSPKVGGPATEIAGFTHAAGLTIVTMITAGICALPQVRRRPWFACPP
jgi:hypothetical protein